MSDEPSACLDKGLKALLAKKRPVKRKRSMQTEDLNMESALELVKKGIRYATQPKIACKKTVTAIISALSQANPPLKQILALCTCLFQRSKVFRAEMVMELHTVCRLLDTKQLYNTDIVDMLQSWDAQYSASFPQIRAAVGSIPAKYTSLVSKRDAEIRSQDHAREAQERMQEIQFGHMQAQVEASEKIIVSHVESMEQALGMLIPTVEDCFAALLPRQATYEDSDDDGLEWEDVHIAPPIETWSLPEVIASCGLGSASYSISIPTPALTATHDLEVIRSTLREQCEEIHKRLLPLVNGWKSHAQVHPNSVVACKVDHLGRLLQAALEKAKEFDHVNPSY